ncbi:MAG: hypothetical protein ABIQ95_00570 [Bdellovibrionia bacterium]
MSKKRSISDLLASGKGDRFKNTGFNLLDDADKVIAKDLRKSEARAENPVRTLNQDPKSDQPINTKESEHEKNIKQSITLENGLELPIEFLAPSSSSPEKNDESTYQKPIKDQPTTNLSTYQPITKPIHSPINSLSPTYSSTNEEVNGKPINLSEHQSVNLSSTLPQPINNLSKPIRAFSLMAVCGLKRKVLIFLYSSAKNYNDRTTAPIAIINISEFVGTTKTTVEVAIVRMIKDCWFEIYDSKKGRGGWTIYRIADHVFHELFKADTAGQLLTITYRQPIINLSNNLSKRLSSSPSSSSSPNFSELNETTTTSTGDAKPSPSEIQPIHNEDSQELPEEWQNIDCTELYQYNVKFGKGQTKQVIRWGKVTPEELQDSIDAFAFDLRVNKKKFRSGPLAAFMGILKNGPYGAPENFESETQRLIRENTERLAYQATKTQALLHEQQVIQEQVNLQDPGFIRWVRTLVTPEDRKKYAPTATIDKSDMQIALLRAYYTKHEHEINMTIEDMRVEIVQCIETIRQAQSDYAKIEDPQAKEEIITQVVKLETRRDEIYKLFPGLKREIEEVSAFIQQSLGGGKLATHENEKADRKTGKTTNIG